MVTVSRFLNFCSFQIRSVREVREPRDRAEGHQERCHQLELQGLWTQLLPRDEAQAHHLHRQGTNFILGNGTLL